MRQLIAIEFVTHDGVVQAPGGPDEDTSGGFAHGGWIRPYADAVQSAVIRRQMSLPFDLLLGRTTFEIWAATWRAGSRSSSAGRGRTCTCTGARTSCRRCWRTP